MDKCRAFDVWLDKRLFEMEAIGLDEAFYAGWQSRQAEVDEKDKRIDELECALKKINENLDLHDCESCWQHYFEIEKVLPKMQRGEHEA